jgi:hypothetical protein
VGETKDLSKDEKLALTTKIVGHLELAKAGKTDGYDVLMLVAHLLFPGQKVALIVSDFRLL